MKELRRHLALLLSIAAVLPMHSFGQGRGGATAEWATSRGDAQRTGWVRSDLFISPSRLRTDNSRFGLQWKLKLINQPRQLNSLTQGVTIGASSRTPLSIVGGSSDNVFSFDNVSGIELWERHFDTPASPPGTMACPGGLTALPGRPIALIPPVAVTPPVGFSTSPGTFLGGVGEPGEGVPAELMRPGRSLPYGGRSSGPETLKLLDAVLSPPPNGGTGPTGGGAPGGTGGGRGVPVASGAGRGAVANPTYVIASDGVLHTLGQFAGKDLRKPAPLLPPNAQVSDIVAVDNTIYATTLNGCGGVPDGMWAIDISGPEQVPVLSWKTNGGSPAGGPAFGAEGTLFVAIGDGKTSAPEGFSNAVVALDKKTLQVKDWFTLPNANFATAPMVFHYKDTEIVAAAARDGRIFLLNAAALGGTDHQTPLSVSASVSTGKNGFIPGALATWEDSAGAVWVLEPAGGPIPAAAGGPSANGAVTNGAIIEFKVAGEAANASLRPAWTSRDMVSPLAPIVVNGVVFAVSSGEYIPLMPASTAERISHSVPAVLYALDGATGKQLWDSGRNLTSFAHGNVLWASGGQVYISTWDGNVYAFGYPMGRR